MNITQVFTENLLDETKLQFPKGTKAGVVFDSRGYVPKPLYRMVGNGMTNGQGQAYPLLETMCDFNKAEAWFFKILLDTHSETTGLSDISKCTFTRTDLNVLSKAFKSLHQRNLVKRVRRQVYMINPSGLITNNWQNHNPVWQSLQ